MKNHTSTNSKNDIKTIFNEKGYYLAKKVFNDQQIKILERDFDKIVNQLSKSGEDIDATWEGEKIKEIRNEKDRIFHTHNVHKYSSEWLKALYSPKFTEVVTEILGEDVIMHHNKLFQKPAENGSPFPMHQDWSYFPTYQDSMIAGIIHISNAMDEMGCLRVYEGSHRLGRVQGTNGQESSPAAILSNYHIENAIPIEAEAGDVVFFHYFTLHGSMPNRSSKTRKTVLVQMHSGTDKMEDGVDHPNENLVLNGWNHHITRVKAGQ